MEFEFLSANWHCKMNINISSKFFKPEGKEQIQRQIASAREQGMTWEEIDISEKQSFHPLFEKLVDFELFQMIPHAHEIC